MKRKINTSKKSKVSEKDKRHQKDFVDLRERVSVYKELYLSTSALPEIEARKEECDRLLFIIDKFIRKKVRTVKTIETVRGVQFKIGDYFYIKGDKKKVKYEINCFPDNLSAQGKGYPVPKGRPTLVEVYIEDMIKSKSKKHGKV